MTQGVYAIINRANGDKYIGSTQNITRRWSGHRHSLKEGTNSNHPLQNAWRCYGSEAFMFTVLEEVHDVDLLQDREAYHMTAWKNHGSKLYNIEVMDYRRIVRKQQQHERLSMISLRDGYAAIKAVLERALLVQPSLAVSLAWDIGYVWLTIEPSPNKGYIMTLERFNVNGEIIETCPIVGGQCTTDDIALVIDTWGHWFDAIHLAEHLAASLCID